jgi:hypothetical protein
MTRTIMTLSLFPLLALCSCGPSLGNVAVAPAPETEPLWIPDDVKHDPAARSSLMEQLRVQIMHKTRAVPETNRLVVRERLRRQLDRAGFDMQETTYILSSLDEPRGRAPDPQVDVARRPPSPGGGESSQDSVINSP